MTDSAEAVKTEETQTSSKLMGLVRGTYGEESPSIPTPMDEKKESELFGKLVTKMKAPADRPDKWTYTKEQLENPNGSGKEVFWEMRIEQGGEKMDAPNLVEVRGQGEVDYKVLAGMFLETDDGKRYKLQNEGAVAALLKNAPVSNIQELTAFIKKTQDTYPGEIMEKLESKGITGGSSVKMLTAIYGGPRVSAALEAERLAQNASEIYERVVKQTVPEAIQSIIPDLKIAEIAANFLLTPIRISEQVQKVVEEMDERGVEPQQIEKEVKAILEKLRDREMKNITRAEWETTVKKGLGTEMTRNAEEANANSGESSKGVRIANTKALAWQVVNEMVQDREKAERISHSN